MANENEVDEWEDDEDETAAEEKPEETKAEKSGKVLNSNKPYTTVFEGRIKYFLQKNKLFCMSTKKFIKKI